jgi:hypothetical protein
MDYQITPSALEVIKNSHIPINDLIDSLEHSLKGKEKMITVKEAINLMFRSHKDMAASRPVISELKARGKQISVPRRLLRTYSVLKRYRSAVTAGHIARITHRKKITEKIYLDQLVSQGYVEKTQTERKKIYYELKSEET